MASPPGFEALFDQTYIDYANADIVGTFDDPVVPIGIIGPPPTDVDGAEQITEVRHLPVADAIAWMADSIDDTSADVLRLAAHLDLV